MELAKLKLLQTKTANLKQNLQLSTRYLVSERCDEVKNQIDLQTEKLIQQLNEIRQLRIAEIDTASEEINAEHKKRDVQIKNELAELSEKLLALKFNPDNATNINYCLSQIVELESNFNAIIFGQNSFNFDRNEIKFNNNVIGELKSQDAARQFSIKPSSFNFVKPIKYNISHATFNSKIKQLDNGRFVHAQSNSKINFSLFIMSNNFKTIKHERTVYPSLLVYENFLEVYKNKLFVYLELYDGDENSRARPRNKSANHLLVLDDSLNILTEKVVTSVNYEMRKIAVNGSFILCLSASNEMHVLDWSLNDITERVLSEWCFDVQEIEYFNQIKLCEEYLYVSYKRDDNDSSFYMRVISLNEGRSSVVSDFELNSKCHEFDVFNQRTVVIFHYVGPGFQFYDWISGKIVHEVTMAVNASPSPLILIKANTSGIFFYCFLKRQLYKLIVDVA
jgi:hypothetical protein